MKQFLLLICTVLFLFGCSSSSQKYGEWIDIPEVDNFGDSTGKTTKGQNAKAEISGTIAPGDNAYAQLIILKDVIVMRLFDGLGNQFLLPESGNSIIQVKKANGETVEVNQYNFMGYLTDPLEEKALVHLLKTETEPFKVLIDFKNVEGSYSDAKFMFELNPKGFTDHFKN